MTATAEPATQAESTTGALSVETPDTPTQTPASTTNLQNTANIPASAFPRVVIVGGGFAGIEAAKVLENGPFQVVLLDKNNYHQFQPLFYQVATAGLEPSSISFPLRKLFHNRKNVHVRVGQALEVDAHAKVLHTSLGAIKYDHLILAMGADTHYFGQEKIKAHATPMKSVGEALYLRNQLLQNYEDALLATDDAVRQALLNVVVVGGGPTGVEVSGALAEMRTHVLPKDIPELDFSQMRITLIEASKGVLNGMKAASGQKAHDYLTELGVEVRTGMAVTDYDGTTVTLSTGDTLLAKTLIWAAGIKANQLKGLPAEAHHASGRLVVDRYNRVLGTSQIYALGDMALMASDAYPKGHPQVAQVAMQMARNVAHNLLLHLKGDDEKPFVYQDLGSMATVGRNKAVADFKWFSVGGILAWMIWMFIHLISLVGLRSKLVVFINWVISYLSYDQSLRLIIKPGRGDGSSMKLKV